MICVTGGESSVPMLARRLQAHRRFPLQEVRLDLLDSWDPSILPLLRSSHIVVTCRSATEGGRFKGTEAERIEILRQALTQEPGYLDLEASTPTEG